MSRIDDLVKQLEAASAAYYGNGDSSLTDAEYDAMRDELENLDPNHAFLSVVGAPVDGSALTKVRHEMQMGSLKKITPDEGEKAFNTWLKSVSGKAGDKPKIAVQPKKDGSSIAIVYKGGKFAQAITRGDGIEGEDVTHTVRKAQQVPMDLGVDIDIHVRGEVLLHISEWEKHLSADTKNPRNTAAGLVRRSDATNAELLRFYAFDALILDGGSGDDIFGDDLSFSTVEEQIGWLSARGFTAVETRIVAHNRVPDVVQQILDNRENLDYEIDGAVIKLNDMEAQEALGEHGGRPYWARAWKFPSMGGRSTILDVEWSIGTRGRMSPVAKIAPVEVGGVTITSVSLHNMDIIEGLGVHIGDEVEVIRANDVIPKIVRVLKQGSSRTPITIDRCPHTGATVKRDGPFLIKTDWETCPHVNKHVISRYISKRNIMYLGDSALDKLVSAGKVGRIRDLYFLTMQDMVDSGVGEGMGRKILDEIKKSMQVSIADLIGSLSIDLLGRSQAQNIVDEGIGTLSQWRDLDEKQLATLPRFGATKASRIMAGLRDQWSVIEDLASFMEVEEGSMKQKKASGGAASGKLGGKSFCFTGTMSRPRKELEGLVSTNGGSVASVSGSLDYLVIADPSSTSSKAQKARKLGIELISEQQFMGMVG